MVKKIKERVPTSAENINDALRAHGYAEDADRTAAAGLGLADGIYWSAEQADVQHSIWCEEIGGRLMVVIGDEAGRAVAYIPANAARLFGQYANLFV